MKKVLSVALILTTMFNQVGANYLEVEASKPQKVEKQVELQAKENVSRSDEELQRVVDQVLVELKKRAESKSDSSKKAEQSKSSLHVQVLKTLFKPVYWVGKAGVFIVKQLLWLILGSLMGIIGSVVTTYAIFKTGSAGITEAEDPIKNIIDKTEEAIKNMANDVKTVEFLQQINNLKIYESIKAVLLLAKETPLLDISKTVESSLEEMDKLLSHLEKNPELAQGILSAMFNLLRNCKESMQPDEFKSYLKKVALIFHPDKLKNLRNISEEDANKIYQLTTELMNKQ